MRTFQPHPLHFVVESLSEEPSYEEKAMFGCRACYFRGELKLVLASQEEPWKGLLIPTDQSRHDALLRDFPELIVHPVLKKWLYLPEDQEDFESLAEKLVTLIDRNDSRIGVEPKPQKSKQGKNKQGKGTKKKATQRRAGSS